MRIRFTKFHFEKTLARAEEALNLIGYIPFISIASASVRSLGGILQFCGGLIFAIGYFLFFAYRKPRNLKNFLYLKTSAGYAFHGGANFFRAKIEAIPFLSLVTLLPYDRLLKKRFKYSSETQSETFEEQGETIEI